MQLAAFSGEWSIDRRIEDRRAAAEGSFAGKAWFRPVAGAATLHLAYREEGALRLGASAPMTATRGYDWRAGPGETVEVWFEDGRFFHRFACAGEMPCAEHDCPPDFYRVRYDFRQWPVWRVNWQVTGPRKDYAMVSTYRPAGQSQATGA